MNDKINVGGSDYENCDIPVNNGPKLNKPYGRGIADEIKKYKIRRYITKIVLFLLVGCLFWICLYSYSLSQNKEDNALLDYKEAIQNNDSSNKNSLDIIKREQNLINDRTKLNDKYKKEIEKIVNKYNPLSLFISKTYADEEVKITYDNLKIEGMSKPPFEIYSQLKDECFAQDVHNKKHCIKTGLSIAFAECSWKDYNTPFGLQSKDKGYKKWVSSYKKFWYKGWDGGYFYGYSSDKPAPTRYCTSEESSGTVGWCENGHKNFERVFFNLTF